MRSSFLLLLLLLFFALPAPAQYEGPAVEACRAYAKKELERDGTRASSVHLIDTGRSRLPGRGSARRGFR